MKGVFITDEGWIGENKFNHKSLIDSWYIFKRGLKFKKIMNAILNRDMTSLIHKRYVWEIHDDHGGSVD